MWKERTGCPAAADAGWVAWLCKGRVNAQAIRCLFYTSEASDDLQSLALRGRVILP